jgi:predicted metallo-beta-lactamase superfamily hydrolase
MGDVSKLICTGRVAVLKVMPLAFESLGVRSMATCIETGDINILIDPAVALAPKRFGLPPHPVEEEAKATLWGRIKEHAAKADVLVVTHYHFDHFDPKEPEIYSGKMVLLKHPRRMINRSQRERAAAFLPSLKGMAEKIAYADNRSFKFEDTEIRFSKPVPHGATATRGYVIEASIRADETFLFTSDVQGPLLGEQVEFILGEKPDLVFVDGPTTYIDSPYLPLDLREANENLVKIVRDAGITRLVVDHHLTRDLDYRDRIKPAYEAGEELGVTVECAAEFLRVEPNLLEARRRDLYESSGED